MPANTPDQQITEPIDADAADNPVAFNQAVGDIEPRLARYYTNVADRTTRMLSLHEGALSYVQDVNRQDIYDGAAHVSLHSKSFYGYSRSTADQNVGPSNTALQNLTSLGLTLDGPNGSIFDFDAIVFYDSNTTADIKFAVTVPAGVTMRWGIHGLATGAGAITGDFTAATTTVSGTALSLGGGGLGSIAIARIYGDLTMGATTGAIQLQAAQNTSDASATTVYQRSMIRMWRMS